ncbi:zinc uptake transcriptional repressor [Klebsiella pneumoniae]|uniref:Zinc uptake regulation protein n=5 Tax=Gammaproteobacteria TaxID=1236 RepID=A0A377WCX6_KLEPN|nr:zinc uptake transcriptional repressor [Klebsiella pneumoniae]
MDKTPSQEMLAHAEKLCAQRGVRLTPQRLEVLRLMSLQQGAISAYDLLDLLREKEPQAKPPTVYRALEFLLEQGFVHKVESTNSYVLCHLFDQPTHSSAMFICDRCGVVKEEAAEGVEDIMHTLAARMGFALRHNVIEAHGLARAAWKSKPAAPRDTASTIILFSSKRKPAERLPQREKGLTARPCAIQTGTNTNASFFGSRNATSDSRSYAPSLRLLSQPDLSHSRNAP